MNTIFAPKRQSKGKPYQICVSPYGLTFTSRYLVWEIEALVRVAVRFFSGVPHPHLLGVCCPNPLFEKIGNAR
jgi:hypothetical protein